MFVERLAGVSRGQQISRFQLWQRFRSGIFAGELEDS